MDKKKKKKKEKKKNQIVTGTQSIGLGLFGLLGRPLENCSS